MPQTPNTIVCPVEDVSTIIIPFVKEGVQFVVEKINENYVITLTGGF